MKYCVYKTTYHGSAFPSKYDDKNPPTLYIGYSTLERITSGYRGSVSSKKYKDIWYSELKQNFSLFDIEILKQFDNIDEARQYELQIQIELDVVKNPDFFNMSLASPNGFFGMPQKGKIVSEETRKKLSNRANTSKGYKHTPEAIEKISIAASNPSEETRKKIGEGSKNWERTTEVRTKMSNSKKGKPLSDEHKRNIGLSQQGNTKSKGYKHSQESKEKMSISAKNNKSNKRALGVNKGKTWKVIDGKRVWISK